MSVVAFCYNFIVYERFYLFRVESFNNGVLTSGNVEGIYILLRFIEFAAFKILSEFGIFADEFARFCFNEFKIRSVVGKTAV